MIIIILAFLFGAILGLILGGLICSSSNDIDKNDIYNEGFVDGLHNRYKQNIEE